MISEQFKKLHVLVVDDDETFLRLGEGLLKTLGITNISTAHGCSEAVAVCQVASDPIDVILADMDMRDGNGLQLLKTLRTGKLHKVSAGTCFIMLTAISTSSLVLIAGSLGCSGFLLKPVSANKIRDAIQTGCARRIVPDAEAYEKVVVPEAVC